MRNARNATHLSREDEARERRGVDPRELIQDRQRGEHPIAIAHLKGWGSAGNEQQKPPFLAEKKKTHIFELFGSPV